MAIKNNGRITAKLPEADQVRHENRATRLGIKTSEYVRTALEIAEPELERRAIEHEEKV